MGRPTRPTEAYRDDPDALSLHTQPEFDYDDAPEISGMPPAYTDDEAAPTRLPIRHMPPATSPGHTSSTQLGLDKLASVRMINGVETIVGDSRCDTDPVYLEERIRHFAQFPPRPLIVIQGSHTETTRRGDKKETKTITDFKITLDLEIYLRPNFDTTNSERMHLDTVENNEKTYRGSFMKSKAPFSGQDVEANTAPPKLTEWCHRYCASTSKLRIFRLERVVYGLDQTLLKNRLEGLIRSTGYRGHTSISFPVENRAVDIYSTSRPNQWRLTPWIRWLFYLTFLWLFAWPYLLLATTRYTVVRAVWPFSSAGSASGPRAYTTISEEQWFERWYVGVRRLVLDRFQGEASAQMLAGVIERPADPPVPGRIRTGHQGVDAAVGLLQTGLRVASDIQRGNVFGGDTQGGWGGDC
ncbi:hypothetical protein AOQ84DRAFT_359132 [Glonium stellatum]|uniref:Uncharacterized protein n=1 Tax=Glonium stellatum TaxID=574774 RepID=A0A8E2FC18_9PEZI|nr:hypothetical protein AOQ84DRAFT_359132 [Glonium stellatum]